ncbi:adenylate/guanylate cyclase domain-containing protein [Carboxylicivirga sp. N1Y90]|uniref:adenylate/guanylate cyclase domain-containing protein n=1 Tax=Carboxylicivirga fragile TaxID=3417571 RepID=UPI003D332489|nr:response regulator [Marinilabiliaceae bacterium N1Y90]
MRKKLLIVDDSIAIQELLSELLTKNDESYEVLTADDGIEGCKLAIKHRPDLILMDWEMPKMNGIQAITNLKRNDFTKDIPVIIISASSSTSKIKVALNAGAIDYINKPIEETELMARVNAALTLSATIKNLTEQRNQLIRTNHKNDSILRSILPEPILNQIKDYGSIPPKQYQNCVVIFVDMVDFTSKSDQMSPGTLLRELHETFNEFDKVIDDHHCTRIKTIGDAYMAVCGMFRHPKNVAREAVSAAVKLRQAIVERNKTNHIQWELKVGLYAGDVICSSVSTTNLSFDIFGDTVNMASRLQDMCEPMQINISKRIKEEVEDQYHIIDRTPRTVKGKGVVPMFYLHHPIKPNDSKKEKENSVNRIPLFAVN